MSRGFVKEDDQEEVPIVPRRAYLPDGVPNLVTRAGMEQLLSEEKALTGEKNNLTGNNENERRIALNLINAKLNLLNGRIAEAKVVDLTEQPQNEIRFGATVTLEIGAQHKKQVFQIVGVDEADLSKGKISFISPLARVLINKKEGDHVSLNREKETLVYKVLKISYL